MALQQINVATPNSNTGDTLRDAFVKVNANTTDLLLSVTTSAASTFNGIKVGKGGGNLLGNTAVGGGTPLNSNTSGLYNTALGYDSLKTNQGGSANTAIGISTLEFNNNGSYNTSVGFLALQDSDGNNNTAIGSTSSANTTIGNNNTSVGSQSLNVNQSGSNNTAIGVSALYNSTGNNNTALGGQAGTSITTQSNSTCLGYNAQVTASNQVQLGDSATTTYVYGTVQNRSDIRDKAEVRNTVLGLDFINELRPVDYKWDIREDYKTEMPIQELPLQELPIKELPLQGEISDEDYQVMLHQYNVDYQELLDQSNADYQELLDQSNADFKILMDEWLESVKLNNLTQDGTHTRTRYHHGLIAQEVQDVIEASGVDFGGFQDHSVNGGQDVLSIGYTELIAPMIKAIQELKAEIELLKAK